MSAFARAAARASVSDARPALAPALPSTSPLTGTDQRLHLPEFLAAMALASGT